MSLASSLDGHPEVLGALVADRRGQLREPPVGAAAPGEDEAAATAVAIAELASAGAALGMQQLQSLQVRSERRALLVAVRDEAFLLVAADPQRIGPVQKLLEGWQPALVDPPQPPPRPAPRDDAWTLLRRALVRGQLAEATGRERELDEASAALAGRPGSEALPPPERERLLQLLLDGIGLVLAGDGLGGGRALREVADPGQPNLSFRWLALHWSAQAALRRGALAAAGAAGKEALAVARQLDEQARAVTRIAIGELLSNGKEASKALPWLEDARTRFERLGDAWGSGRACLAQARALALLGREAEAAEAARQAGAADARWDEPRIFLARRALCGGDLAAAEQLLEPFQTPAADRARSLMDAVRQGVVSQADVGEYLREHDAPASARSIRALERIARAVPRFAQARAALAFMLLNLGRGSDAATIFRGLLARDLAPADRAFVMLGLGCIASAEKAGPTPEAGLPAAAAAADPDGAADGAAALVAPAPASPEPVGPPSHPPPGALPAAGNSASAFSGPFSALALPDLLEFLRAGRRTGLLVCSSPQGRGALRFTEGHVISAASPATPRIGQLLVESRKVAPDALDAAARLLGPEPADHLLSVHLLREGLVPGSALEEALGEQVGCTIRELLRWKSGAFVFDHEEEGGAALAESPVAVDVQGALMRVFQELDEASRDAAPAGVR